MPKKLEKLLRKQANKKGLSGKDLARYVYGAMRNQGWKPGVKRRKQVAKI
jgi:hypothetical protein